MQQLTSRAQQAAHAVAVLICLFLVYCAREQTTDCIRVCKCWLNIIDLIYWLRFHRYPLIAVNINSQYLANKSSVWLKACDFLFSLLSPDVCSILALTFIVIHCSAFLYLILMPAVYEPNCTAGTLKLSSEHCQTVKYCTCRVKQGAKYKWRYNQRMKMHVAVDMLSYYEQQCTDTCGRFNMLQMLWITG